MNAIVFGSAVGWFNEDYCLRLTQVLVHFLWQGSLLGVVIVVVNWLLRKRSANARYVCSLTGLLLMAACLPATLFFLPSRSGSTSDAVVNRPRENVEHSPGLAAATSFISVTRPATVTNTALDNIQPTSAAVDQIPARSPAEIVNAWMAWLSPYATGIYFVGMAVMLGRLCLGLWGGRRLRRAAIPEIDPSMLRMVTEQARRLQLRITPPLAWSARISVPIVVGVLRPMILLPATLATGLSPDHLQAVLLHELAHVRRYDLAANVLQRIVESLLFFHPAVWWLSRRVSLERESACDDLVLRADCPPLKYADALLRVAELCAAVGRLPIADQNGIAHQTVLAATGNGKQQLKRRVLRVLGSEDQSQLRPSPSGFLLCFLSLATLLILPGIVRTQENPSQPVGESTKAYAKPSEIAPPVKETKTEETFPIRIFGRALDTNGKPITGAKIYLSSQVPAYRRVSETTTDENGRYKFIEAPLPLQRAEGTDGYQDCSFEVFGQAEGYGFAWRPTKWFHLDHKPTNMEPGLDEPRNFDPSDDITLDLRFSAPAKLAGRIVDGNDKPIANTRLEIRFAEHIPLGGYVVKRQFNVMSDGDEFEALNEGATVPKEMKIRTTDAQGHFEFAGLPPGCRFMVDLHPPGFAKRSVWATTQKGITDDNGKPIYTDGMQLTFIKPVEVPILVLYGDNGKPAPKVWVSAHDSEANSSKSTDANGQAILNLPPGHYDLELFPAHETAYCFMISETGLYAKAEPPASPLVVRLPPAGVVEISVLDADTGKGVAGIQMWKSDPRGSAGHQDYYYRSWEEATHIIHSDYPRSDADGKMHALFEPGMYRLGVGYPYLTDNYQVVESDGQGVDLQPGKPVKLTFHLRKQK